MESKETLDKLQRKIEMGLPKHILVYGVILWGIPTALFYAAITPFFTGQSFMASLSFSIWAFPVGGIFYGLFSWLKTKRQIEMLKTK